MLTQYIQAALKKAKYKILEDGEYFGEIPGFEGVWASAKTLEDCREELSSALETWLLFSISRNIKVPKMGKYDLSIEYA